MAKARRHAGGPDQARAWSLAPARERIQVLHGERKSALLVTTKTGVPVVVMMTDAAWDGEDVVNDVYGGESRKEREG